MTPAENTTPIAPSATLQVLPPHVEQLKREGNTLFAQSAFLPAIQKYIDAIKEAPDNAILHANKAACLIGLKRFKEAIVDAQDATQLDPSYAKGWGRLGAAHEALNDTALASKAYTKAIACFGTAANLSDADKRLKLHYEQCLNQVRDRKYIVFREGTWEQHLPWDLAKKLPPQPFNSSAWVILAAYQDFEDASKVINSLHTNRGMTFAQTGGLTLITNAILSDDRVFHIASQDWLEKYNNYVMFESRRVGAWGDTRDPAEVIRLAKARLLTSGWDSVRPALAVTVRGWIMHGFVGGGFGGVNQEIIGWYEHVIRIIELGRLEWPNVSKDDRGAIFEDTFLRGVRVLHIDAYMQALAATPGRKSPYSLARLLEMADAMLVECTQSPRVNDGTPAFILSFENYPIGTALSMMGFYHIQMAKRESKTPEEFDAHMRDAAGFYLQAAEKYPEDDEQHVWFLCQSLQGLFAAGGPKAKTILALLERIRLATPKMRAIWENSPLARQGRDTRLNTLLETEKQLRENLKTGKMTLEDRVMLKIEE